MSLSFYKKYLLFFFMSEVYPEFLLDQIGKMRNCSEVPTIARAMDYIADAVKRIADE